MKGLPCAYCREPSTSKDHIPPNCVVGGKKLITVPCCEECRKSQSKDDEYLRLLLVARLDLAEHPEIDTITEPAIRSLEYPEAKGLKKTVLDSIFEVDTFSPKGIYLGRLPAFKAKSAQVNRVIQRIVKGLFYHEFGVPLAASHNTAAWIDSSIPWERVLPTALRDRLQVLRDVIDVAPVTIVRPNVFEYRVVRGKLDPFSSVWLLVFYGKVRVIGFTFEKSQAAT
jgi:hypothetical protein